MSLSMIEIYYERDRYLALQSIAEQHQRNGWLEPERPGLLSQLRSKLMNQTHIVLQSQEYNRAERAGS